MMDRNPRLRIALLFSVLNACAVVTFVMVERETG